MRHRTLISVLTTAALSVGAVATVLTAPVAGATGTPTEDRQLSTPASWWTYSGLTATQVATTLSTKHARLTDVTLDGANPATYSVTEVANTGVYADAAGWFPDGTAADLTTYAAAHQVRPSVVSGFRDSLGRYHFAAIWVPNSGTAARPWSFYYGTQSYLVGKVAPGDRVQSLSRIQNTSYYTALIVANTGGDATSWWWYFNLSQAAVTSYLSKNTARLVDIDRNADTGTYNVIMIAAQPGLRWSWYTGSTLAGLTSKLVQTGMRQFDIERYTSGGTTYFAGIGVNNLNALSTRLIDIIGPTLPVGSYGFYLRTATSTTALAGLEDTTGYEPASALKVLIHAYLIHQESLGTIKDADPLAYKKFDESVDSCPDDWSSQSNVTSTVANVDALMMASSDNGATLALENLLGAANILAYVKTLGISASAFHHHIGCPTPQTHNTTTLSDLGTVWAASVTGKITTTPTWNAAFHDRTLNEMNFASKYQASICPVVVQEAAALKKSAATATRFCSYLTWAAKGGDYTYGSSTTDTGSHGGVSVTGVPRIVGGKVVLSYYVFGEYVDRLPTQTTAQFSAMQTARSKLYGEALRPYVHSALATWPS